jgi:hypothetical protein
MHTISLTVLLTVLLITVGYLVYKGQREKYWRGPRAGWRRGWGRGPFRRGFYRGYYDAPYVVGDYDINGDNGDCNCIDNTPTKNDCVNGTVPYCNDDKCRCDY